MALRLLQFGVASKTWRQLFPSYKRITTMSGHQEKHRLKFWNGKNMPIVGLGTERNEDDHVRASVNWALEAGYRHFDTAYMYRNEHAIGDVIYKWIHEGKINRNELFVTTKLPFIGNHPDKVSHFLRLSLSNLKLDYADLYLIHFPVALNGRDDSDLCPKDENGRLVLDKSSDILAVWRAMEDQVDNGRARSIGLSNFNSQQIDTIVKSARIKPANLQVECHAYFQQKELKEFCDMRNITLCAYAPLGSRTRSEQCVECATSTPKIPDVLDDPVVGEIAKSRSKSPAQILLRHLVQRNIAVIPRSCSKDNIFQNIDVFDFELSEQEMRRLDQLDRNTRTFTFDEFPGLNEHPDYPFNAPF